MDPVQLVRYIAVSTERKVVVESGLGEVVPIPKATTTLNSFVNPTGRAKATNGETQFLPVLRQPDKGEIKKLIGLAISVASSVCMDNHYYTIDGLIRRQKEGGAIGSELTGENSRVYMSCWDRRFINKLKKLGIKTVLYTHYVDDVVCALEGISAGWEFNKSKNKMSFNKELAENDTRTFEARTAEIMADVANSLDNMLSPS